MNKQETTIVVNVIRELENLGGLLNGFEAAVLDVNGQPVLMLHQEMLKELSRKTKICASDLSGLLIAEDKAA